MCLYVFIYPVFYGCVTKQPKEAEPIPKNQILLEATGFTQQEPTLMEGVVWCYTNWYSNYVIFDIELTHSLNPPVDWITVDETTNLSGFYNVDFNPAYFRVGVHWTNELTAPDPND